MYVYGEIFNITRAAGAVTKYGMNSYIASDVKCRDWVQHGGRGPFTAWV